MTNGRIWEKYVAKKIIAIEKTIAKKIKNK
jgi:hypothetical protein